MLGPTSWRRPVGVSPSGASDESRSLSWSRVRLPVPSVDMGLSSSNDTSVNPGPFDCISSPGPGREGRWGRSEAAVDWYSSRLLSAVRKSVGTTLPLAAPRLFWVIRSACAALRASSTLGQGNLWRTRDSLDALDRSETPFRSKYALTSAVSKPQQSGYGPQQSQVHIPLLRPTRLSNCSSCKAPLTRTRDSSSLKSRSIFSGSRFRRWSM